jgi:hypothetical protein
MSIYEKVITPTWEPPPEQKRKVREIEIQLDSGDNSLDFLQKVYRNTSLPLPTRMRAAAMALPHEVPKLGVSMNVNMSDDFAARLDAAIARSNGHAKVHSEGSLPKTIEHDASEIKQPMLPNPGARMRRI